MDKGKALVCVTGASGFIASFLVKLLLDRGYKVRGTVRSLTDPSRTSHLRGLPGAEERLELVEADLLKDGAFNDVVKDCQGVFHTASPFFLAGVTDPERQLIQPAVQGTLNVLEACSRSPSVAKVVVTSSTAAVAYNPKRTPDTVVDESCFSDPDYCREMKAWYILSKTLAEQEAWKFAKEKGLNLVTINPAMVIGPLLQPTLNTSCEIILKLINGSKTHYSNACLGWVGVGDVAEAHLLAYENPNASGRYLCVERVAHYEDVVETLRKLYPEYPIPTECEDNGSPKATPYAISTRKLQEELGLRFHSLEHNLKECVESLKLNHFTPA
ncbi:hypothetical protein SELMODRAFT_175949 [Selaginella moellendorffii]|uniref:NAD-dependent epimerase/dehydratase domain-containing protein n=1 Tax=Selaginella moellendorffii TaxID=88036 RepID=D8S0W8_SELML|nr:cinnamoyl-CoA reductase 1 [Selaginella moellendorffii]EFJ22121.1 hypothetical protein SELMODRAFT_175949 [Selaginella moellendorffii]|eukprot:XP_002977011.1 cinnamoyl-CoA reductase 1 [Selaginella moellendorffii]